MSHGAELARRVGEQIRLLRLDRGWTQQQLAQRTGLAQQNLSSYERGEAKPRLDTLARILDALDGEVSLVPRQPPIAGDAKTADLGSTALLELVDRRIEQMLEEERRLAERSG